MYRVEVIHQWATEPILCDTWQQAKKVAKYRSQTTMYGAIVYRPNGDELCRFYNGVER